jgi:PAS domain S-box-containing protein
MMSYSLRSAALRLTVVLGPALLVLALGVLAVAAIQRAAGGMEHVARAYRVSVAVEAMLTRVVDAQTAMRGFIVTGDEQFLEGYHGVADDVELHFGTLRHLIIDPEQRQRLEELRSLVEANLEHVQHNIALRRTGDVAGAEASVRSGIGKARMDALRAAKAEFEQAQALIVDDRQADLQARAWRLSGMVLLGSLLAVALAVLTNLLLARRARAQEALVLEVSEQNVQLQEQAAELELQTEELQAQAAQLEDTMVELEMSNQELQHTHDILQERDVERAAILEREHRARKRAEESERQFRTMANSIPQLAWMADEAGTIFWYNDRWYAFTGTSADDMPGRGWQKVHHPDYVDAVMRRLGDAFERGSAWEDTFPMRGSDGEYRWFLSRALPIADEDGHIVRWFGTHTDVTEQKVLENERDRAYHEAHAAREDAEAANRAKMDFLAAMSHELRTPLNAIAGFVDLLDLGVYGGNSPQQLQALSRIRSNQRSLLVLINDILQYAKVEAGSLDLHIQDVPVVELVPELDTMMEPQVRQAELAYTAEIEDPSLVVRADPDRIRQILLNLLTNAVKFTPPGGTVGLSCEARGDWIDLRVRDTGRGIPAEMVQRIFDPFVQLDRKKNESSRQGVGLGLPISRDLAEAMGGTLTVESLYGRGSTFVLSLPAASPNGDGPERRAGEERRSDEERRSAQAAG